MEGYRPYYGKHGSSKHRKSASSRRGGAPAGRGAIKLIICLVLLAAAALLRFVYPSAYDTVGKKLGETVNYKAALTALGEGISGEKKFTEALGEAFTDAFTTGISQPAGKTDGSPAVSASPSAQPSSGDTVASPPSAAASPSGSNDAFGGKEVSNAVVQAFLQSQEEYSDYTIPAGVTYGMPDILLDYTKPVKGVVSSTFGFRHDPTDKTPGDKPVKFHYGTDIAAKEGTEIDAFAAGKVIAAGNSQTLGEYVVISHSGGVESEYGHCKSVYVKVGQTVAKGGKIAAVGNTGNATDPCLHFELKVSGINVNPQYYIDWA